MSSHLSPSLQSTPPRDTPTTPVHRPVSSLSHKLSPIINNSHALSTISSFQPQFAELLTPHNLRRRKRPPSAHSVQTSIPLRAGPSDQGFYTDDGDLFRGAAVDPTRYPTVVDDDAITLGGSSITSSSSGGGLERGRRATMAVLERFGTVIGVRRGSDSSSSTASRSEGEMRSRRMSRTVSTETSPGPSKRQHLPKKREFVLLLPPPLPLSNIGTPLDSLSSDETKRPMEYPPDRVITTSTLSTILDEIRKLRAASGMLPDNPGIPVSRPSRPRPKMPRGASAFVAPPVPSRPTRSRLQTLREVPVRPKSVSDLIGLPKSHGCTLDSSSVRSAESTAPSRSGTPSSASSKEEGKDKGKATACWWLDVACPGWEDLRDLGELLSLHPLTLEDVLHQDPREKLEVFDKLGYYFVVVRALDEGYFKYTPGSANNSTAGAFETVTPSPDLKATTPSKESKRRGWGMGRSTGKNAEKAGEKVEIVEDNPGMEGLEGVGVGAVNIYLVVFVDGIVSFHFEDISKHTKRVLQRILSLANDDHGSDWIAHGLLDSIVDAFFPLIRYVDNEVDEIDSLSIDPFTIFRTKASSSDSSPVLSGHDSAEGIELSEKPLLDEKAAEPWRDVVILPPIPQQSWTKRVRTHLPRLPTALVYIRLFFLPTSSAEKGQHQVQLEQVFDRSTLLRRITDTRRLVTGLSRLLGGKHQVIGRLRKRGAELGGGVEAYIGDVEDHVLLLQTSLYHYEYILSHCQPAYLSHLSVSFSLARGRTDQAILALSTVTISILPMQFVIGLLSMNIHGPRNGAQGDVDHREPNGSRAPFNYFAGTCVLIFLVACCMLSMIRYWRWAARRNWSKYRGVEVPGFWRGYWGWE